MRTRYVDGKDIAPLSAQSDLPFREREAQLDQTWYLLAKSSQRGNARLCLADLPTFAGLLANRYTR